jgi:hypothetical protein
LGNGLENYFSYKGFAAASQFQIAGRGCRRLVPALGGHRRDVDMPGRTKKEGVRGCGRPAGIGG